MSYEDTVRARRKQARVDGAVKKTFLALGTVVGVFIAAFIILVAWNVGVKGAVESLGGDASNINIWTAMGLMLVIVLARGNNVTSTQ